MIKLLASYPMGIKGRAKVLQLLGETNVSHVNAKPVTLEGVFTGRIESVMIWGNDFILQDETGFVACLYNQPLGILEALFGIFHGQDMINRPVRVHGWYRRFNAPFVEIDRFELLDTRETHRSWVRPFAFGFYCVVLAGAAMAMAMAFLGKPF
jgi:hypothetical protein